MSKMDFEVVERPDDIGSLSDSLLSAIVETAKSGKAIRIDFPNASKLTNFQSNLRAKLRKHELNLKYRFDKVEKKLMLWAESLDSASKDIEDFDSE